MSQRTSRFPNGDLLAEIYEAQAVLRAAWQTYPDMPEVTGVLGLLRTKLEKIENAAQTEGHHHSRNSLAQSEAQE